MKQRREVKDTIQLDGGLVVVLDLSSSLDAIRVRVSADGNTTDGFVLAMMTDPETVERVAAVIRARRSVNGDTRIACPDHGYQRTVVDEANPQKPGRWRRCEKCIEADYADDSVERLEGNDEVK